MEKNSERTKCSERFIAGDLSEAILRRKRERERKIFLSIVRNWWNCNWSPLPELAYVRVLWHVSSKYTFFPLGDTPHGHFSLSLSTLCMHTHTRTYKLCAWAMSGCMRESESERESKVGTCIFSILVVLLRSLFSFEFSFPTLFDFQKRPLRRKWLFSFFNLFF